MSIVIFILLNYVVLSAAYLINYKIFRFSSDFQSLISWFIIYLTQIIVTELILGICGILSIGYLSILNLLIFALAVIFTRKRSSTFKIAGFSLGSTDEFNNKLVLFLVCIIASFSIIKLAINLFNPPFGWDSLNYHFPFAVEWLKHANLSMPPTVFDDPSPSYYPINGSLFYLWLIIPLKNVFLADLGQVPFFVISVLAVYGISLKLGLNQRLSFFSAALFLLIPNFFKQLQVAYVDVMVGGLFLVCVNYLLDMQLNFNLKNTIIYSLSLGLLIGTKTIALPYSFLLFIPFVYYCLKNRGKAYFLIICAVLVTILGGFSYIRNYIETGNPLYPLDMVISGRHIFQGVINSSVYRAHFIPEDYNLAKMLFHEGLGLQTIIFVLPGMFLALPMAILRKRRELNFILAYVMVLPILIFLVYRYLIPLANLRYLYALLGLGVALGFYTAKSFNIPKQALRLIILVCAIASMSELAKRQELVAAILVTFALFGAGLYLKNKLRLSHKLKIVINIALAFSFLFILIIGQKIYIQNEFNGYIKMTKYSGFWPDAAKAWEWLNSNTNADNIAYAGRPVPFPLYGSQLKNNVFYVSVNKTEPAKLHYYKISRYVWGADFESEHKSFEEKNNYRSDADYSVWLNNLLNMKTRYLFVYSLHQTKNTIFPIEDSWAKSNPDRFYPAFINNTIHIYKVNS